jgi:hypothetical protein
VIAPAGPGAAVRCGEHGAYLVCGEEGDERAVEALGGDREHALDHVGVLGVPEGGVAEQRVDRRQADVAGAGAVVALALEVIEEGADQPCVEVRELERRRWLAGPLGGEREQQAHRVAVAAGCVRARLALGRKALGEERLRGRGEQGHGSSPRVISRRLAASASSSGAAVGYR